jgi:hypothetical protein
MKRALWVIVLLLVAIAVALCVIATLTEPTMNTQQKLVTLAFIFGFLAGPFAIAAADP